MKVYVKRAAGEVEISERQVTIAQYVSDGYTSKEIAALLGTTKRAIDSHVREMKRKTKAHSICHLVAILIRAKIIK